MCEIDIVNPKYTTFTKLVQVWNFITFELKVFWHEERETQSFYADCFYNVSSLPNQCAGPIVHKFVWPRLGLNLNLPVRMQELNSLLFLKSQKSSAHASGAWCHPHPLVLFPTGVLFWHLWMTHPPHTYMNTCAHVCTQLTHALSRKVLSLTKPKGKIYKMKSLRNYITLVKVWIQQFSLQLRVIINHGMASNLRVGKLWIQTSLRSREGWVQLGYLCQRCARWVATPRPNQEMG